MPCRSYHCQHLPQYLLCAGDVPHILAVNLQPLNPGTYAQVTCVVATNCKSAGEALRLVDQKDIIKSDFVLVTGAVVSNVALAPVLEAHAQRRAQERRAEGVGDVCALVHGAHLVVSCAVGKVPMRFPVRLGKSPCGVCKGGRSDRCGREGRRT
eukprot:358312-Chlamydomonas_euryale.AAC.3